MMSRLFGKAVALCSILAVLSCAPRAPREMPVPIPNPLALAGGYTAETQEVKEKVAFIVGYYEGKVAITLEGDQCKFTPKVYNYGTSPDIEEKVAERADINYDMVVVDEEITELAYEVCAEASR